MSTSHAHRRHSFARLRQRAAEVLDAQEEVSQLLDRLDASKIKDFSDRSVIWATRTWRAERGPYFTPSQIAAVRRIAEESRC